MARPWTKEQVEALADAFAWLMKMAGAMINELKTELKKLAAEAVKQLAASGASKKAVLELQNKLKKNPSLVLKFLNSATIIRIAKILITAILHYNKIVKKGKVFGETNIQFRVRLSREMAFYWKRHKKELVKALKEGRVDINLLLLAFQHGFTALNRRAMFNRIFPLILNYILSLKSHLPTGTTFTKASVTALWGRQRTLAQMSKFLKLLVQILQLLQLKATIRNTYTDVKERKKEMDKVDIKIRQKIIELNQLPNKKLGWRSLPDDKLAKRWKVTLASIHRAKEVFNMIANRATSAEEHLIALLIATEIPDVSDIGVVLGERLIPLAPLESEFAKVGTAKGVGYTRAKRLKTALKDANLNEVFDRAKYEKEIWINYIRRSRRRRSGGGNVGGE